MARFMRWLFDAVAAHPEVREELIVSGIQRRPAVYFACVTAMLISSSAVVYTGASWAYAWLCVDAAIVLGRLYLSFRFDDGAKVPVGGRAATFALMFVLFVTMGMWCAVSVVVGPPGLVLLSVITVLAVFAGVSTRWAAFPRLTILTILTMALPMCVAICIRAGGGISISAVQFGVVALMLAAQTIQNHQSLIRLILAEHHNAGLARIDPLTGLGNRFSLFEALDQLYAGEDAGGAHAALLYLDLDGFKGFNDARGHDAGDELLRRVARTMRDEALDSQVYRIGGDEFVVVQPGRDETAAIALAERIIRAVSTLRVADGGPVAGVGVTAGIAFASRAAKPRALIARADEALYAAKRAGKGAYRVAGSDAVRRPLAA